MTDLTLDVKNCNDEKNKKKKILISDSFTITLCNKDFGPTLLIYVKFLKEFFIFFPSKKKSKNLFIRRFNRRDLYRDLYLFYRDDYTTRIVSPFFS